MATEPRYLALPVCAIDQYPDVETVGGESLNVAIHCRRNGARLVSVLGAVGNDNHAATVRRTLRNHGIDISHLHQLPGPTARQRLTVSPEGEKVCESGGWDPGVIANFRPSESDWTFVNRHDVVITVAAETICAEMLDRTARPSHVVVDFLSQPCAEQMAGYAGRISIAIASGSPELADQLSRTARSVDTIFVVTLGAEGSIGLLGRERYFQPAIPVPQVVDTTGCGDAFVAGFTVSWFKTHDVATALRDGALSAARVVVRRGTA